MHLILTHKKSTHNPLKFCLLNTPPSPPLSTPPKKNHQHQTNQQFIKLNDPFNWKWDSNSNRAGNLFFYHNFIKNLNTSKQDDFPINGYSSNTYFPCLKMCCPMRRHWVFFLFHLVADFQQCWYSKLRALIVIPTTKNAINNSSNILKGMYFFVTFLAFSADNILKFHNKMSCNKFQQLKIQRNSKFHQL